LVTGLTWCEIKELKATMQRMNPKHYDKLIEDFKARKKEILEKDTKD
jgi:hypothetical protein